jgi:hypothetical protein
MAARAVMAMAMAEGRGIGAWRTGREGSATEEGLGLGNAIEHLGGNE